MAERKTILVIDDDEEIRKKVTDCLKKRLRPKFPATTVWAANSLEDAKKHLEEIAFDVIVTDLVLDHKIKPSLDGIEVLKEAKKRDPDTQVIILSSYHSPAHIDQAYDLG